MNQANIATLEAWKEIIYANAQERWPSLTPQQFGDAARTALANVGNASIQTSANLIKRELVRRYGGQNAAPGASESL